MCFCVRAMPNDVRYLRRWTLGSFLLDRPTFLFPRAPLSWRPRCVNTTAWLKWTSGPIRARPGWLQRCQCTDVWLLSFYLAKLWWNEQSFMRYNHPKFARQCLTVTSFLLQWRSVYSWHWHLPFLQAALQLKISTKYVPRASIVAMLQPCFSVCVHLAGCVWTSKTPLDDYESDKVK